MNFRRIFSFSTVLCLLLSTISPTMYATPPIGITGGSNVGGGPSINIPITDWQVTGGGTIPVHLYVPSGTLSMTTTTGLTFSSATTGSSLYFSGSLSDVNTALATLQYNVGANGTYIIELSLVDSGQIYYPTSEPGGNNHVYEVINSGPISANDARTAALARTINGVSGYLASITSANENNFVAARLQGDGWFGASDAAVEGDWKWLDDPEALLSFWSGTHTGGTVNGQYANWSTSEPNDYQNGVPGEDCAQFYITSGKWNDYPCTGTTLNYYVVEYGTSGGLVSIPTDSLTVTVASDITPPTITNISSDKTDGYYKVGEVVDIDVTFSEVVTSTGDVTVTLETGTTDRTCTFTMTSGTTGTCNYTVQEGDTSPDLTVATISGTIKDAALNTMVVFEPVTNLAANKAIVIDTTAPAVPVVTTPSTNDDIIGIRSTASGTCETGATVSIASAHLTTNPTTATCTGGAFSVALTWLNSANNVSQTLTFSQTDLAGNVSGNVQVTADPARTSGGGGGSPTTHEGCRDPKALNYDAESISNPALCLRPTPTPSPATTEESISPENKTTPVAEVQTTHTDKALSLNSAETSILDSEAVRYVCDKNVFLTRPIKFGAKNNPEDVAMLEVFLNTYENANLPVDGVYSREDYKAVIKWQEKYREDVLKPWGLKKGTGYVYIKSLAKIKEIEDRACMEAHV